MEGKEYSISFSIYYEDEYSDGGKEVVAVEKEGTISYYYRTNELYNHPLALNNSSILTATVTAIQKESLQVVSDTISSLTIHCEGLPENITKSSTLLD